jgi:hypothetical protein
MKRKMKIFSAEKVIGSEHPLLSGYLLNFEALKEDILGEGRQREILKLVQSIREQRDFRPPFMIMDLVERKHIELYELDTKEKLESNSSETLKIVMSAWDIVNLDNLSSGSNSVVKCNAAVPIYRWFQAANLILKYKDVKGRVIPFPLDQEEKRTVFHMLRVTAEEFAQYQQILEFACLQHSVEQAFEISARFSYEVLYKRGVKKLTADQVDHTMTHVILQDKPSIFGIAVENAKREDLENEYLIRNQIFY